jgi:hypothetical protein
MGHDISRKQFLSLGVLGGLGLFGACALEENSPKVGSGGSGGSSGSTTSTTTASGGAAGTSTSTSSTSGSGGSGGATSSSTGGGMAGNGGSSSAGGAAGNGGTGGSGTGGGGTGGSGSGGSGSGNGGSGGTGGSKDAGGADAGSCKANPVAAISMNHNEANNGPHYLAIPLEDIAAGVETIYRTVSMPNPPYQSHIHSIKLTAADFAQLRAGMTVTKRSCDGHEHQYAIRCGTMAGVPGNKACMPADFCGAESNPC